ncbi:hypothetical protein AQUCO_01700294v1 [Aquilegia coerulea]|uniref:Shikimate dehydrogenase substrate binding N-terminal domain-containing protein n=1 Tax=Aquilegia coerulea TaxID=218851 RepID=A0A2G5DM85_AQUCA|nr:hypothetical protein AQUCO_01700294v1 [Aquilegia coerulea]
MGSLGMTKNSTMICVALEGQSVKQIVYEMIEAKTQGADLVEIRLDYIKDFQPSRDLEILLKDKPLPVVVVYRPKWDGGLYEGDEKSRLNALLVAMELGADYIEIELKAASGFLRDANQVEPCDSKIIVSCHVVGVTPSSEEFEHLVAKMQTTGADIIKLVTDATDITDLVHQFKLFSHCQVPLVTYSTGERGLISQLLCPKYGGFLVYGTMKSNSIPGLPTLDSLIQAYKPECINEETTVFGLISKPVGHSKGPLLHNPTFRHVGYNGVYVPMFVDDLNEFFRVYSSDFAGYSVGIPYKEAITAFCDEIHPLAQSIGAVNTIIRRPKDGKLVGYNTDCEASITAIEDALKQSGCTNEEASLTSPLEGKQFVLAGAGGAGRALAFGARSRGARIVIFDIDYERAKSLAHSVSGEARPFEEIVTFSPQQGAILANATPIGMHPNTDRIPVAAETLAIYQLVFDSVYTPRKTRLLNDAEAAGAIVVSGVEMFLRQAMGQFNLFTGQGAPEDFMREIILAKF